MTEGPETDTRERGPKGGVLNPVWEACIEVLGYEPKTRTEKSLWGKHVMSLTEAEATPERIRAVAQAYHKSWPTLDLTITALEKWYSHFLRLKEQREKRAKPCPECGIGGGHLADCPRALS